MFNLKPNIKEAAIVEFRFGGQLIKKSTDWLEKNVAVAIGKYHLEYLFEASPAEVEKLIRLIDSRIYPEGDPRHPKSPAYELRHIRSFAGDRFAGLDMADLEREFRGVPEPKPSPKPPKPDKPK